MSFFTIFLLCSIKKGDLENEHLKFHYWSTTTKTIYESESLLQGGRPPLKWTTLLLEPGTNTKTFDKEKEIWGNVDFKISFH